MQASSDVLESGDQLPGGACVAEGENLCFGSGGISFVAYQ
jgi:hypothetical protein